MFEFLLGGTEGFDQTFEGRHHRLELIGQRQRPIVPGRRAFLLLIGAGLREVKHPEADAHTDKAADLLLARFRAGPNDAGEVFGGAAINGQLSARRAGACPWPR